MFIRYRRDNKQEEEERRDESTRRQEEEEGKRSESLQLLISTPWRKQHRSQPSCEHEHRAISFVAMIARRTLRIVERGCQKAASFLTKPKNAEAGAVAQGNNSGLRLNNAKPFPSPYQKNMRDAKNAKTSKWSMTSLMVGLVLGQYWHRCILTSLYTTIYGCVQGASRVVWRN